MKLDIFTVFHEKNLSALHEDLVIQQITFLYCTTAAPCCVLQNRMKRSPVLNAHYSSAVRRALGEVDNVCASRSFV